MRKLLVSSFVAVTAVLGVGYGAFEYWVSLKSNSLPSLAQGKLTAISAKDIQKFEGVVNLLDRSPLPWHQQQAQRYIDLLEVAEAAHHTFQGEKVGQLQVGQLLTLQREMENYVQRYPNQPYSETLEQELPSVRSFVTFFPVIKASAGARSVDSALRATRRGATLAALVVRQPELVAEAAPVLAWTKAENDVLYDYSQALQTAERSRIGNEERLKIGQQVCTWLKGGQGYWGVRTMFDQMYKSQLVGDYYHNRDAYIRFSTERLCPDRMASLTPPPEPTAPQIARAPVAPVANAAAQTWSAAADAPRWSGGYPAPYVQVAPMVAPGGMVPAPIPGNFR